MDKKVINSIIDSGHEIAMKLQEAKTLSDIDALKNDVDSYSDYVNNQVGFVDEFADDGDEKYSDISFYLMMAVKEKEEHIDYYNKHPEEISDGILDFEEYLDSKEWLKS